MRPKNKKQRSNGELQFIPRAYPANAKNPHGIPPSSANCVLKRNNIDITFEMLQVLSSLWQEQGISQQALAEKTAKDKACMTNLMANLEKKGWIMRQEDPNDRRNRLVYLTPAGEEISDRVRPLIKDFYTQTGQLMGIENLNACSNQLETLYEIFNQF